MKPLHSSKFSMLFAGILLLAVFSVPQAVLAQKTWRATVGAESTDMAKQALAFLPNEIWIHVGDRITWTSQSDEIHTVTFLIAGQPSPAFQKGCPGFSFGSASFDGSTCITTPPLVKGQTFTVIFPKAGNYKVECLVHLSMFGTIHVLNASESLPHNQDFYDDQAAAQRKALLADIGQDMQMDHDGDHHGDDGFSVKVLFGGKHVTAGVGETRATPGGNQTASIVRFLQGTIEVEVGDTVEWSNHDPEEPHTITFGTDPMDQFDPSANVTLDADGARHAFITSPSENVHSGFIEAVLEDEPGVRTNPLGPTRFRVTFKQPGTYSYYCVLHDNLGMVGKVIVHP